MRCLNYAMFGAARALCYIKPCAAESKNEFGIKRKLSFRARGWPELQQAQADIRNGFSICGIDISSL